jgi:hypothetical protein
MRKEPALGLAGLLLAGVLGCQMDRPYYSRYTAAQNHFAPTETAYRPRTVVTMRAEEVPDNPVPITPVPAAACQTVQLVGATATPVAQAPGQAAGSAPMVTVTIPAMKIVIPMTATVATPPVQARETGTVTQLPATVGSVVQASSTASIASSSSKRTATDPELHPAIHVQEEPVSTASIAPTATSISSPSTTSASTTSVTSESPPMPEPIPEPKPKGKSTKKESDAARLPKLSLLPPDPPPDVPMHRTSSPAAALRIPEPPPPPPIPRSSTSSGPILPADDSEPR